MNRVYLLCIFFCVFFVIVGVVYSAQSSDSDGGYLFGYPKKKIKTIHKETTRIEKKEVAAEEEDKDYLSDAQENLIKNLKRAIAMKDKRISFLENRVERLMQTIDQKDTQLYMMQPPPEKMYEVKKGDNLWKIAARRDVYDNPYKWITIYNANMKKIDNPDIIYPGQLFEIPK